MLARIRKAAEEKDSGFTLIELLVVMIIIGILAAIAIPVFLNQRKKAVDTSLKSDLRTVANEMETSVTDGGDYASVAASTGSITIAGDTVKLSSGNTVRVVATATTYCIDAFNDKATANSATNAFVYKSDAGGLQDTKGKCA